MEFTHYLVADEMGDLDGVLMFDETGFVKRARIPWVWRDSTVALWAKWRIVKWACLRAMPRGMAMPW